jgi:hypothetical protein
MFLFWRPCGPGHSPSQGGAAQKAASSNLHLIKRRALTAIHPDQFVFFIVLIVEFL